MSNSQNNQFYKSALDPITLILKLDLDIFKMYYHAKNEVSYVKALKRYSLNGQIDRQTDSMRTFPHHFQANKQTGKPMYIET